jgi:drug/metabolite transporter (DMT)-like permease
MVWIGLILGIVACSSSVVFIKSTAMDPAYLASLRLWMASLFLLPWFLRDWRRFPEVRLGKILRDSLPAGLLLAVHFVSWNEGVRRTLAAHGTLIVNMVPVVLPLMLWLTHRERVNRWEVLSTLVAVMGLVWLAVDDYQFSTDYLVGDLICFGSMVAFAGYLAFGRKNRDAGSIFLYVVPLYVVAAAACMMVALLQPSRLLENGPHDYLMAFLLALIPGTVGHTLINYAMRHLRGQVVGVLNVSQFLFAGVFAYFLFDEVPKAVFYAVSVCVVAACVVAVLSHRRTQR